MMKINIHLKRQAKVGIVNFFSKYIIVMIINSMAYYCSMHILHMVHEWQTQFAPVKTAFKNPVIRDNKLNTTFASII